MQDQSKDYYSILGISRLATQDQIKQAYRQLALIYHPDRNQQLNDSSIQKFRELNEAYQTLKDSQKRKNYDLYGFVQTYSNGQMKFNFKQAQSLLRNFYNSNKQDSYKQDESSHQSTQQIFKKNKPKGRFKNQYILQDYGFFGTFAKNSNQYAPVYDSLNHLSDIGGEGISKSVTTATKTINGQTMTIRRTTVKKKDGTKDVTQQSFDQNGSLHRMYSLAPGQGFGSKAVNYK